MRDMTQRETRWDDRALVAAGMVAVGALLCVYGLHAWVNREARSAVEWCFWHLYCDITECERGRLVAEQR